jgi:hypothetical protein
MKTIVSTLICILFVVTTYSQDQSQILKFKKDFYMERSKKQNRAGWILLGGGAVFAAVGEIAYAARMNNADTVGEQFDEAFDFTFTDVLGSIGYVAVVTSIPLFISAGANKRKANRVSLSVSSQNYYQFQNTTLSLKPLPVLTLHINL